MSTTETSERAAFETSMKAMEGYPFAGAFATLMWKSWQARADLAATLASQPVTQSVEPVGWKLVPTKPTEAMLKAGQWEEFSESSCKRYPAPLEDVADVYRAMIFAAPQPSVSQEAGKP